jgi:hypothetical protein
MNDHKFKPGQFVRVMPTRGFAATPAGRYEIVRTLPPRDDENQYRIRSTEDNRERVVRESELL